MRISWPIRVVAVLAMSILLAGGATAFAQVSPSPTSLEVSLREASREPDGTSRLVVSVAGATVDGVLPAQAFSVSEDGAPVTLTDVTPLLESRAEPMTVALLIDVSGSTTGAPLEDAKAAAQAFVADLTERGIGVALVAFGAEARLLAPPGTDAATLGEAIAGLEAGGETALFDAIVLASEVIAEVAGQRAIVVFSDGGDTVSTATLQDALTASGAAHAAISTVALATTELDDEALRTLASGSAGRAVTVDASAALAGAFDQVARDIAAQYVLTYVSPRSDVAELTLEVAVTVAGRSARDGAVVVNPTQRPTPVPERPETKVRPGPRALLGEPAGLWIGLGSVALSVLTLATLALEAPRRSRTTRSLRYAVDQTAPTARGEGGRSLADSAVGRAASGAVQRVPKPKGFEQRLQDALDRAGWPLRASEFLAASALGCLAMVPVGYALVGRWWFGALLGAVVVVALRVTLRRRIQARTNAFLSQLPDTLQILASALRAGYALPHALDAVVREARPPVSNEFARALGEHRFGARIEDALDAIADRIGGADFRWVAMAIGIQRQVGGDLSALLETVAGTMRERERLQRHVQGLSAEGRLSALILSLLPFVLTLYLMLVNPTYLEPLYMTTPGRFMVVLAVVLLGAGITWLRRIVRIDV